MRQNDRLFKEIYKIDEATDRYMIELALDQYTDIFNEWDPAPFKRRAIDSDLELYLEGSSEEIPLKYPIELYFTIPDGIRDAVLEEETRQGLSNSFTFKLYLLKKELQKTNTRILHYTFLGFGFLVIAKVFTLRWSEQDWRSLLSEALFIGGWVFIWEAVSLFFFTNRDLYFRYRIYRRLQNAPVIFREAEKP